MQQKLLFYIGSSWRTRHISTRKVSCDTYELPNAEDVLPSYASNEGFERDPTLRRQLQDFQGITSMIRDFQCKSRSFVRRG